MSSGWSVQEKQSQRAASRGVRSGENLAALSFGSVLRLGCSLVRQESRRRRGWRVWYFCVFIYARTGAPIIYQNLRGPCRWSLQELQLLPKPPLSATPLEAAARRCLAGAQSVRYPIVCLDSRRGVYDAGTHLMTPVVWTRIYHSSQTCRL